MPNEFNSRLEAARRANQQQREAEGQSAALAAAELERKARPARQEAAPLLPELRAGVAALRAARRDSIRFLEARQVVYPGPEMKLVRTRRPFKAARTVGWQAGRLSIPFSGPVTFNAGTAITVEEFVAAGVVQWSSYHATNGIEQAEASAAPVLLRAVHIIAEHLAEIGR